MARTNIPPPILFQIRPANKGMNVSVPPQSIQNQESSYSMNIRYNRGRQVFRQGFRLKYSGARESIQLIDAVKDTEGLGNLVAFGPKGVYLEASNALVRVDVYNGLGTGQLIYPYLGMDPSVGEFVSVDSGEGKYDFVEANSGALLPTSGYANIMAMTNGKSVGIIILAYTGIGSNVEGEVLKAIGAPSVARTLAIFDNRLIIGGTEDGDAEIGWSSYGRFDWWNTGIYTDTGRQVLGDSPDKIQAMKRLGSYLIVYKEDSIHLARKSFIDSPALYFELAPTQGNGCAAPKSVVDLGERHIFVGSDNVYIFSLQGIKAVGGRIKQEMFYGDNGILPKYINNCVGAHSKQYGEYWLFVASGKWPSNGAADIDNILVNPQMWDDDADDEPDDWIVQKDGDGTSATQTGMSLFGIHTSRLAFTTGTYVQLLQQVDLNEVIHDKTFALMIWYKASGTGTMRLTVQSRNGGGANPETPLVYVVPVVAGTTLTYVYASFTVDDADAEMLSLYLRVQTAGINLDVDAVHLVDITDVDSTYLIEDENQYKALTYINGLGEQQIIPFIVDKIGPYIPDTVWVYNYEEDSWAAWRLPMTGFGYDSLDDIVPISELVGTVEEQTWRYDEKRLEEAAPSAIIGQCDSNIYEIALTATMDWEGVLDVAFQAYWESKDFDLDRPAIDKTFSRLVMLHEASHPPVVVTVGVTTDSGLTWVNQDVTIRQGRVETFADFFVTGPQVRFRVKATTTGFLLTGYVVKIIPRGESNPY